MGKTDCYITLSVLAPLAGIHSFFPPWGSWKHHITKTGSSTFS